MKLFLKDFGLFILFLMVFYSLTLFVWGKLPMTLQPNLSYQLGGLGHTNTRLKEIEEFTDIDILILGSSHAYRGFDPRVFRSAGLSIFNLGSTSQSPMQTRLLLKRYLSQLAPKLIIYVTTPGVFTSDGVESAIDIIANDKNDINTLLMTLKLNHVRIFNTFIYGVMRDLFDLTDSYKEPLNKNSDTYIAGGYVEKEMLHYKIKSHKNKNWSFNDSQLSEFEANVTMIRSANVDLILVWAPVTSSLYSSYQNKIGFDSMMSSYSTYYNFNEILQLDDSFHFYDSNHLNQNGVDVFNNKLIDVLQESQRL